MAIYYIRGVYEYEGEVEADNEADALKEFYGDLNRHYSQTIEEDVELIEEEEDDDDEPTQTREE
jgi:hypothetical protein